MTNLQQRAKQLAQQFRIGHLSRRAVLQRAVLIAGAVPAAWELLRRIGVPLAAEGIAQAQAPLEPAIALLRCSFCDQDQNETRKLIAGPSVVICDECVEVCNHILAGEEPPEVPDDGTDNPLCHELQALYDRASAQRVACKSCADADAIHAWLDTPDCVYRNIVSRGKPGRRCARSSKKRSVAPC